MENLRELAEEEVIQWKCQKRCRDGLQAFEGWLRRLSVKRAWNPYCGGSHRFEVRRVEKIFKAEMIEIDLDMMGRLTETKL